jgi:two-component system sensor histidine kinase AgrC
VTEINRKKQKRFTVIITMTILIIILLSSLNLYATYYNTRKTIELTIANQGMLTAQTVLNHFDVHILEEYLKDEGSSQTLQMLDYELSEAKEYSDAKYAYILKVNEENQPQLIVDGLRPKDSGENNGDCCILSDELKKVFVENKPFFTRIENNSSGTNVTAGVPIVGSNKEIIGSLIVNESVATVDKITDDVMKSSIPFFVFSGLFVLFSFGIFLLFQLWLRRDVKVQVGETEETYQGEFQSMLQTMRSIRHDFINHIQVIQGLLKIGREDRAVEYVNSLTNEVESIELPIKVKNPALLILLQAKWVRAQNDKVDMHLLVDDHHYQKIKSIDLIKILSNLIDNAFDATLLLLESERFINIEVKFTQATYLFKVENIGPTIPEELRDKIFNVGFSTKEERRGVPRGDGLSIVKEVVSRYRGEIDVQSNKNSTTFIVKIPIKS